MKIIGFNTTRIHGIRAHEIPRSSINTDILFTNIEKERLDKLKDSEAIKTSFKFSIFFKDPDKKSENQNEVSFEGSLLLALDKEESKEFLKAWKKNQIPPNLALPLYNFILRRCSTKALILQEDVNLPTHLQIPQLKRQAEQ